MGKFALEIRKITLFLCGNFDFYIFRMGIAYLFSIGIIECESKAVINPNGNTISHYSVGNIPVKNRFKWKRYAFH